MNRLGRSGRALWLVVLVVSVSCGKGTGGAGGSASVAPGGSAAGASSGAVRPRVAMISPSSASIVPTRFATNAELTAWVERLRRNGIDQGDWDRSCKPGCSTLKVHLQVVPGASTVDYDALGSQRPVVAIIEPKDNEPPNETTKDAYAIETGKFTYAVYVEQDPQNAANRGMLWHILKIPYTMQLGKRVYDLSKMETLGGHSYTPCQPTHTPTDGDRAGFYDCGDNPPHAAMTTRAAPARAKRADTMKLLAPGALARAIQDTSRTDPLKPLWVSCLDGCCTASGT